MAENLCFEILFPLCVYGSVFVALHVALAYRTITSAKLVFRRNVHWSMSPNPWLPHALEPIHMFVSSSRLPCTRRSSLATRPLISSLNYYPFKTSTIPLHRPTCRAVYLRARSTTQNIDHIHPFDCMYCRHSPKGKYDQSRTCYKNSSQAFYPSGEFGSSVIVSLRQGITST